MPDTPETIWPAAACGADEPGMDPASCGADAGTAEGAHGASCGAAEAVAGDHGASAGVGVAVPGPAHAAPCPPVDAVGAVDVVGASRRSGGGIGPA
ncbi:hypothetical protein [Sphaerisporangium sp. NPDC051011]|uniref:hypothetical protein n=1 Tax=Sphaerisporangium sp. NPDC051011 TaxID=3155792 RepID=UPI0033E8A06F